MTCTRSVLIIIKAFSSLQPKIRYFKQLRNIYVFLRYKNENISWDGSIKNMSKAELEQEVLVDPVCGWGPGIDEEDIEEER